MDFEDFFRYDVIRSIESNLKRMVQTMTLGRKIQKMRKEKGELVGFNNCLGYEYDRNTKTYNRCS